MKDHEGKLVAVLCVMLLAPLASADAISVNELDLEHEVKGGGRRVVLFEAGALSGMAGWDAIWGRLPENTTAIRYSRRGEGKSSSCRGDMTAVDYARDTEQLLEALGVSRPFVYVSHSYGGKVARAFAVRNPEMLAAMLFVDPSNPRDVEIVVEIDPENGPAQNETTKRDDFKMGAGKWCFLEDLWDKQPSSGFKEIGDIPMTLIAGVKRIENPKLIFHTDRAREKWGQAQKEWVSQFPRGKAVMATESGHFVQDEQPELVVRELSELLERADWD